MTHRERDDDGWPYVTEEETWLDVIGAGFCLFLICFALFAVVLTTGAAVTYP